MAAQLLVCCCHEKIPWVITERWMRENTPNYRITGRPTTAPRELQQSVYLRWKPFGVFDPRVVTQFPVLQSTVAIPASDSVVVTWRKRAGDHFQRTWMNHNKKQLTNHAPKKKNPAFVVRFGLIFICDAGHPRWNVANLSLSFPMWGFAGDWWGGKLQRSRLHRNRKANLLWRHDEHEVDRDTPFKCVIGIFLFF